MMTVAIHQSVMIDPAMRLLAVRKGGLYVDCTLGLGGHAEAVLERLGGTGRLIGMDRDREALELARRRLERFSNCSLHHENYKNLPLLLSHESEAMDGCLLDLGISSMQLESAQRGFSFRLDGPLDMRMDQSVGSTAAELINRTPKEELAQIFREYGEEPAAAKIADALVQRRKTCKFTRTLELAEAVAEVARSPRGKKIHPATRVFQALRIAVNRELSGLSEFLDFAVGRLKPGGRLVVISFHSLEDRLVKRAFRLAAGRCVCFRPGDLCSCPRREVVALLTPRPLQPDADEVQANPRSRSAKLRAVEKLPQRSQDDVGKGKGRC